MTVDDFADRLVRIGATPADIAQELGDDVSAFPSLNPPTTERFTVGDSSYFTWSFCNHTDSPDGIAPEVMLHNGRALKVAIVLGETAGAAMTYDVLLNGGSIGSVTLASGATSATAALTATDFVEGDVLTIDTASVPDAVTPGRFGTVSIFTGPHSTLAP